MVPLRRTNGFWTLARCKKDAGQYKTKGAWSKGNPGAADAAKKNKWFEECCRHMICHKTGGIKVINVTTRKVYKSIINAALSVERSENAIRKALNLGYKAGGYNWAYCDDEGNVIETKKTKSVTPA